jgi:hypothetical protein
MKNTVFVIFLAHLILLATKFIDTDATTRKSWKYFFDLEPVTFIRGCGV